MPAWYSIDISMSMLAKKDSARPSPSSLKMWRMDESIERNAFSDEFITFYNIAEIVLVSAIDRPDDWLDDEQIVNQRYHWGYRYGDGI